MRISHSGKKAVVITGGDPSGIGPEIIIKALRAIGPSRDFIPVIIGDYAIFRKTAGSMGLAMPRDTDFIDQRTPALKKLRFGHPSRLCGYASLEYLAIALSMLKKCPGAALVTAPVNKASVNKAGFKFSGHTEFLSMATKSKNITMMLVSDDIRVSLVTRHIPLGEVPRHITRGKILTALSNTDFALKKLFRVKNPRVGVAALNPHAGESGYFGKEEKSVISPAIKAARRQISTGIEGPIPADTLFHRAYEGEFDAVIAMYHDQGLGPFKMIGFRKGVNLTLGLPFIRTSPDHGTGPDIAGKGKADPSSMIAAIKLASLLASRPAFSPPRRARYSC